MGACIEENHILRAGSVEWDNYYSKLHQIVSLRIVKMLVVSVTVEAYMSSIGQSVFIAQLYIHSYPTTKVTEASILITGQGTTVWSTDPTISYIIAQSCSAIPTLNHIKVCYSRVV